MRHTRTETAELQVLDVIVCDCCGLRSPAGDPESYAYETFQFRAGYYSSYNDDGDTYDVDLCQHCIRKLLGPYLRRTENRLLVIDSL